VQSLNIQPLPPTLPKRGNWFSKILGRSALRVTGSKFDGEFPEKQRFVLIVAPHTSNWDFVLGTFAIFALGIRLSFLGKDSLFRPPLGSFMRWLGGIPVKRVVKEDRVAEEVAAFKAHERVILALAPEGTRKRVERWRTGFYHVAVGAGVPIVPVGFDYESHTIRIMKAFDPTGEADPDIEVLRGKFRAAWARRPGNFADTTTATATANNTQK
jgi:1-acyl-sn-glycerol-3-phosphate acyltransferase